MVEVKYTFTPQNKYKYTIFNEITIRSHFYIIKIDGLMQERRNSIANALELCLSCINPSIT